MLLDIKGNPYADSINEVCREAGVDPVGDVFSGCSLGKKGFSIRYNELLAFAIVHNWDPAYNKNATTILKSRKKFNQFLKEVNLLEGIAPKNILIEYLRLTKIFFKHEMIITNFLESQRIYLNIEKIADSDLPTCIFGETGTGKELIANIIHKLGNKNPDKDRFIILNCAGMPDHLLHREVFGYAESAFPGATEDHEGYLAKADGGTLFLDEIGDSGELFQKAMLRFLNDGSYNRLGDPIARRSKCRIICTTKSPIQNFQKETEDKVRSDFYHRITGHIIYLPPLRHVRSNIPLLILLYTLATCRKFNFTDTVVFPGILLKFWITGEKWKGNYRQLKNSVEDYVIKFIHLEKKGGYKVDRPFYNLVPLSGKWFEKDPLYILKLSKEEYSPYNRLFNIVDGHSILPYLESLSIDEKIWNNIVIDLTHMISTPYLHYTLFRFNENASKCDYNRKLYNKYTNFRFTTRHEDFDKYRSEISSVEQLDKKRKPVNGKKRSPKRKVKSKKHTIKAYKRIEATIEIIKGDSGTEERVVKKFVLIPKSKNVPKIIIDDFQSTRTQEFSLLLFLVYERSLGEKDFLSAPFMLPEKCTSQLAALNKVLKWCGIETDVNEQDSWWNDTNKRRWIVSQLNEKAKTAGIMDDDNIIEMTSEIIQNNKGELVKKRIGKRNSSYMLNTCLQARITPPRNN